MKKDRFFTLPVLRKLGKDEEGTIWIYFTFMLPVIVGMLGLAMEGAAYFHLHTDLQELADAAALAGANQLNQQTGAKTAAANAAQNLLSNDPRWSNVARPGLQIASVCFYSSPSPDTPSGCPSASDASPTDAEAQYIKVTTVIRERTPGAFIPMAATMLGLGTPSNQQTSTSAMAQSTFVACNVQPLMMCNPWELQPDPNFADHVSAGMMIRLMNEGNNSLGPGDFALLDPAGQTHSGAQTIRNLLSQTTPDVCFVNNISPRSGQVTQNVLDGINVRFNIPVQTGVGNAQPPLDPTPAPNVIKGEYNNGNQPQCPSNGWSNQICTGNGNNRTCSPPNPPGLLPLPMDSTMSTMTGVTAQIGSGTMNATDMSNYWSQHHIGTWPTDASGNPLTRYAVYQGEVAGSYAWQPGSEPNAPYCTPTTPGDVTRRVLSVAIVNCNALNVQGNSNTSLLSSLYADFFVTKPADSTIYLEFIRFLTPQSDGSKLHHVVQLIR